MKRNLLTLLLMLLLSAALLAGCGGGGQTESETAAAETTEETGEGTAQAEEAAETEETAPAEEEDFVLGFWFAETATKDGETMDPDDLFGGIFYLYFADEETCYMCIDDKRAPLAWEHTENGVTLTGDDTYSITFPDDSQTTMIITINGVEVVLEKDMEE